MRAKRHSEVVERELNWRTRGKIKVSIQSASRQR
jgi:hypothetical protein